MAGHAYKSAVDELDAGVGRELVSASCLHYPKQRLMELNRTLHSERRSLTQSANLTAITPISTRLSQSDLTRYFVAARAACDRS